MARKDTSPEAARAIRRRAQECSRFMQVLMRSCARLLEGEE